MTWNAQIIVILCQLFENSLSIEWYCSCLQLVCLNCNLFEKFFKHRIFCCSAPQPWNSLPYAIRGSPSVASFKKTLKTFLFQKAFLWFYVLFNLVFSRFYAVFYDLSSLGNFYSFSVDKIVLTLFGRFMHFMHVYFMQSWQLFFLKYFYL